MSEPVEWTDVLLGDVRVGDTVRTKVGTVPSSSRYADITGTVVGVRSGSVAVKTGEDTVLFWPNQLERLVRPE
jgi:hypothetical protein